MRTTIYHVSGPGNSLHVARDLQTRIPGSNLVPTIPCLHQDRVESQRDNVVTRFAFSYLFLMVLTIVSALAHDAERLMAGGSMTLGG